MLIMQEDLLSEVHLPKVDLTSLQNVLPQNSPGLACLIKENDYMKNSKALPLHFKGAAESTVPGFPELDLFLSLPGEHAKPSKRKFICKKSLLSKDNYLINDVRQTPRPPVNYLTEQSHIGENDLSWEKHNSDVKSPTEGSSCNNVLPETHSVAYSETEVFVDVVDDPQMTTTEAQSVTDECSETPSQENSLNETTIPGVEVFVTTNDKSCDTISDSENPSEPALCVISEVIGNATETFSKAEDPQEKAQETLETQLITPKKTTDITKIKGWRRKQFFVEKPTTIEYYSISKGSTKHKKRIEIVESCPLLTEDPGNVENAFVCDSLDEFLDREAELKIGYEIPHLYAEFGIKLTSDDVVSRPNLSEEDIQEVGTRYCIPVTLPSDGTNLDDIKEETGKRLKRPIEEDLKPCKVLKLEENKRQLVKCEQKSGEVSDEIDDGQNSLGPENVNGSESKALNRWSNIKLMSKLIALVVYPSPFVPLHPIVQYHIDKLRSYHTKVDKNWANFAVSAVLVNDKRCKRRILPVHCCVKIEKTPTVTSRKCKKVESDLAASTDTDTAESQPKQLKLKKCSVVIERLDSQNLPDPWCMDHKCYNCAPCGLFKSEPVKNGVPQAPFVETETKNQSDDSMETVIVSPRASFDKKVASLLAKKVRLLKYNGDTLTSIDCLKTLTPNTIEFIKLGFVKESFIAGCISIWFLKPTSAAMRSRAFLTFSQTPPVPNAINLNSTAISEMNLPKVITEIVSPENSLDSNEYAILHCNGQIWEIHGSLNITFGKSDKKVEQIFTSAELPELKRLQQLAYDILKVKSVKWWVLDLTQKFRFMELKSGNFNTVITRKKFLETITLNLFGYIPLRKDLENRVLGAYVVQRLLPFILIGPYYLLESHDIVLKGSSVTIPFRYYGEDNVTTNYPLKFFINSVIKNLEMNERRLEGLWLYDKIFLDSTSYLEVVTTTVRNHLPAKYSSIEIDHGYSLNSLTNSTLSGATSGIVRRKDGRVELKKVTVYLYFDIFDLGFVEGELQFDNSVIINHPLDFRTKMKSHKVGDLFIGVIKARIDFFPKDLVVKWFITKHKEDLRSRNPFNRLYLGGSHILTKNGIFYLLRMPETKIEELGLDRNEINKAIAKCQAIKEVRELKKLAALLSDKSDTPLRMDEVLSRAVSEVKTLKKLQRIFKRKKNMAAHRKLSLASCLIKLINSSRIRFHLKIKKLESIEHLFRNENGSLTDEFIRKLNSTRIGKKYLVRVKKRDSAKARKNNEMRQQEEEKMNKFSSDNLQASSVQTESPPNNNLISTVPTVKILNVPQDLYEVTGGGTNTEESAPLSKTLSPVPYESCSFKLEYPKIAKSLDTTRKEEEKVVEKEDVQTDSVTKMSEKKLAKPDGFFKLTSPELPDNIKLCWRNWNVNKLEVA